MLLRTPEQLVKDKITDLCSRFLKEADREIYNKFAVTGSFPIEISLSATPPEISLVAEAIKEDASTQGWIFTIGAPRKEDDSDYGISYYVPVTVNIKKNNS